MACVFLAFRGGATLGQCQQASHKCGVDLKGMRSGQKGIRVGEFASQCFNYEGYVH